MEVTNYKCDSCGKVETSSDYDKPIGWISLHKQTKDKDDFWRDHKDICPNCAFKSGLKKAMEALDTGKTA